MAALLALFGAVPLWQYLVSGRLSAGSVLATVLAFLLCPAILIHALWCIGVYRTKMWVNVLCIMLSIFGIAASYHLLCLLHIFPLKFAN
jgi:hypothetical protein